MSDKARITTIETEMTNFKAPQNELFVPVSYGEVADKITILEIKSERISDPDKLANITKELTALRAHFYGHLGALPDSYDALNGRLKAINEELWQIEDDIRDCERDQNFGPAFVSLARAVYFTNDKRAQIKREINLLLGSAYVEEKSYQDYAPHS
ncbi:DUF6165 family protein [Microvirga sp. 0TCS3.31]